MALTAKVIPGYGLTIEFTATGEDELEIRRMFNNINDDGDISTAMRLVIEIAIDRYS